MEEVAAVPVGEGRPLPSRAVWLVTGALAAYACARMWMLRWVCDDAFISFRYADHLVQGKGLVWNVGERVEGYTNLLWTLLIAAARAVGLEPVLVSQVLGFISFAAVLGAMLQLERRSAPRGQTPLPLGTWIAAAMADMALWATGGLETMTAAAFATGMALLLFAGPPSPGRQWLAGVLGALLYLTRPDGVLIAGALGAWSAASAWPRRAEVAKQLARLAIPGALAVAGSTAFRVAYYGDWLPNTFYAKSTQSAYWDQGLVYLGLLFARNYVLGLVLLAAFAAALWTRRRAEAQGPHRRAAWALLATAGLFGLYVVRSGGDFMFARRFIPVLPLALVGCSCLLQPLSPPRARALLAGLLVVAALFPIPVFELWQHQGRIANVSDEPLFYPASLIRMRRAQGEALGRAFQGLPAAFVLQSGLCVVAYYSGLPTFIENNGLTDRTLARQTLTERGRAGHEKHPTEAYLDSRGVQFLIHFSAPEKRGNFDMVLLKDVNLYLRARYYDDAVMEPLRRRQGVVLLPAEHLFRIAAQQFSRQPCAEARRALERLDAYYFRTHPDSPERERLSTLVEARCVDELPARSSADTVDPQ